MTAGPVAVRPAGRLRLIPAAKAVLTGIRDARKNREAGQNGPSIQAAPPGHRITGHAPQEERGVSWRLSCRQFGPNSASCSLRSWWA